MHPQYILHPCLQCNRLFQSATSEIARGGGVYCSRECYYAAKRGAGHPNWKGGESEKPCQYCGAMFSVKPYRREAQRYCSPQCAGLAKRGIESPNKKGGFISGGYRWVFLPDHTGANVRGYIREHRLVAEQSLGRPIRPDEVVHHRDQNTLNNDPANLEVMSPSDHMRLHSTCDAWSRKAERCVVCGTVDIPHYARGLCLRCYGRKMRHNRAIRALSGA